MNNGETKAVTDLNPDDIKNIMPTETNEKIEMYVETDPLASEKEYVTLDKKDCGSYKFEYEQFWKPGTREEKFEK